MSATRRVVSNTALSLTTDAISKVTRALVFILVARYVGPDLSGAFVVAASYQAVFQSFTLAGTDYLLVREVARDRSLSADYLTHFSVMKAVLSAVSWTALFLLLAIVAPQSPGTSRLIMLLALSILPEGLGEVSRAVLVAHERLAFPAIVAAVVGTVKLALSWLALQGGYGLESVALVVVGASWAGALANLTFIVFRVVKPATRVQWHFFRKVLPSLASFATMGLLRVVEFNVTVLLLAYLSGDRQVGIFNAGYTLVLAVLMVSQAYGSGAMPVLSRLFGQSRFEELALFYLKSVQVILELAVPVTVALIWFSPVLIQGIYTEKFLDDVPVLQLLSPVILLTLFTAPQACMILAADRQLSVVYVLIVSIAVNIAAGAMLMPVYGAEGAAAARLVATVVTALLYQLVVRRRIVSISLWHAVGPPAACGLTMIVLAWLLREVSPWVALPVSGAGYLLLAGVFLLRSQEDRRLLLELLGRSSSSRGA